MAKDLYRRGFLLTDRACVLPEGLIWEEVMVGPYTLYFDPDNICATVQSDKGWACCLGTIMDTERKTMDNTLIARNILSLYDGNAGSDNKSLWDYFDILNGRYVVIFGDKKGYLVNDPTGMRSVWYSKKQCVISSHYGLTQHVTNDEVSPYWKLYKEHCRLRRERNIDETWCLPGDLSPYCNIHLLISNHCLQMDQMETCRFWPRENLPNTDIETVADYIAETISTEARILAKNYDVFQSLTMGNDSRISLAALRGIKDRITFFTYAAMSVDWKKTHWSMADMYRNLMWAKRMSEQENLQFIPLDISTAPKNAEMMEDIEHNHYHKHVRDVVPMLKNMVDNRDAHHEKAIHLRSNLIELVRDNYFNFYHWDGNHEKLAKTMASWSMYREGLDGYDQTVEYYKQLIEKQKDTTIYDYDIGAIFYMEYRMNQWQGAAVVTGTDPAFDTFMLFNQRKLLSMGMSIPKTYKDNNILVTKLIERLWPELLNECFPNILAESWKLVDWNVINALGAVRFDENLRGEKQYEIKCGNTEDTGRRFHVMAEPRLEGIRFGFAENVIHANDYIDLELKHRVTAGSTYYYEFDIFTHYAYYSESYHAAYEIWVNDRCIYQCGSNYFPNKINQVIFAFDASDTRENVIRIRLKALKGENSRLINAVLDVRNVFLRQEYRKPLGREIISATEQLIRG